MSSDKVLQIFISNNLLVPEDGSITFLRNIVKYL